jgi:hypothetical protein
MEDDYQQQSVPEPSYTPAPAPAPTDEPSPTPFAPVAQSAPEGWDQTPFAPGRCDSQQTTNCPDTSPAFRFDPGAAVETAAEIGHAVHSVVETVGEGFPAGPFLPPLIPGVLPNHNDDEA